MTAPTFISATSIPADDAAAANAGPTVTIDKDTGALASAQAGDLVVVVIQYRNLADTGTNEQTWNTETGGQLWNNTRGVSTASHHCRIFWCRFNGTWTADPSFSNYDSSQTPQGTLALTAVAMVFRPDSAADHWVVCNGPLRGTFTAGSTPFTKTITGLTPRRDDTVTLAVWSTADDNTWDSLSGTNWTQSGLSAQYRNTTGSDQSLAIAYQLQGTAAATNNVSLNQATLGGDAGGTQIISFAAVTMPSGGPQGTVGYVQGDRTQYPGGGVTSMEATLSAVGSGNAVVIAFNHETTSGEEVTSITDNQGNQYYPVCQVSELIYEQTSAIAWAANITNAPTTFTVSISGGGEGYAHIYAVEVSGIGAFDVAAVWGGLNPDGFSDWNPATVARTPSVDGCFLLGHAFLDAGANVHTAADDADGWTLAFGGIDGSPDEANVLHYRVQSTASAEDYDIDVPANSALPGMVMAWAAFRPASSGATYGTGPRVYPHGPIGAAPSYLFLRGSDTAGGPIAVGQTTETDVSQAITARQVRALGQATSTEVAQAITPALASTIGQVTETDTAQTVGGVLAGTIAQASETDLAQTIAASHVLAVAQASETDTAQAITFVPPAGVVAQVVETDTAQAIAAQQIRAVGQVEETDTAQAITVQRALQVAQVVETDTAQAVAAQHVGLVAQASETDAAQAITFVPPAGVVAQVVETDTAQAIAAQQIRAVGQVNESDAAQAVNGEQARAVAQASETNLAQGISLRVGAIQAVETDVAQPIARLLQGALGQAIEVDSAFAVAALLRSGIVQVAEVDTAFDVTPPGAQIVQQAVEFDMAQAIEVRVFAAAGRRGAPLLPSAGGRRNISTAHRSNLSTGRRT
jgi:hypothetical protein